MCLPSQGRSLGEGTSSGFIGSTVLLCAVPGWEPEPAGGTPVQLGARELAPLFLTGVDLRNPEGIPQQRNNQRRDTFLRKLDKVFFISAQECKFTL